jgi:PTS system sorbose-specific IIB component
MPIKLFRIDDRLIHGQVIVGWANALKAGLIIVANDRVFEDEFQKCLLKTAVPPDLKAEIYSIKEFPLKNESKDIGENNTIILVDNPLDCLRLMEQGLKIDVLNVGNMRSKSGRKEIGKSVFVTDAEAEVLLRIKKAGVKVELQMVVSDKPLDIEECIIKGGCKIEEN